LKLASGFGLTDELKSKIKKTIRTNASPRHFPAKILVVWDIPYTLNIKKVEIAVREVIHDRQVCNKDALRNPEALDFYAVLKGTGRLKMVAAI